MNSADIIPADDQQKIQLKYCEQKKYANNMAELITKVADESIILISRCDFSKLHNAFEQTRLELEKTREELEASKEEAAKIRAELEQLRQGNLNAIPSLAQLVSPIVSIPPSWNSPPSNIAVQSASVISLQSPTDCSDLPCDLNKTKRAQCQIACVNCRQQHVVCEQKRPCSRCIKRGMESSCIDVPRKKRCKKAKSPSEPTSPIATTPPQVRELSQEPQPPPG